jgi:V/A-type H+-transporting ATPase subunit I
MLTAAMVVNIINGVRQRNYEKILFGPNGAAGAAFYIGLIAMAALTLTGRANLATPAYIVPVLVVPLVLILLKEPLSKLLAHDPTWKDIHPGELLGLGFFELFETLLSYLTNTLSFLRVGAYAIIHVGLMLVVRMLAGSGNIPVLVLGNLFVMGFEGFLVGIQVLRLEFYELFSRFYDDGGIPYQPHIVRYSVPAAR